MTKKLTFIGVGAAFALEHWQSNMLLQGDDGRRLLIDAGGDVRFALRDLGLGFADIDALYLSHQHTDHVGGVEWLCLNRYFGQGPKPDLFINKHLAQTLWDSSLCGGMAALDGTFLTLDDFFSAVHRLEQTGRFAWAGCSLQVVPTVHYLVGSVASLSYGLMIESLASQGKVFLTTDTQFRPDDLMPYYRSAGLIFQDTETAPQKSGVHAHYTELCTLPVDIKKKMWLYHYQDGALPPAEADGFAGFVEQGQVFEF